MRVKFLVIPVPELLVLFGIVGEPLPQISAGRYIFEPLIVVQIYFFYAARPKPLYKELFAFGWCFFIYAFDRNHSAPFNLALASLKGEAMPHNISKQYAGHMEQIITLFDRDGALDDSVLPEDLKILYSGDLRFPADPDRTHVVGNFVSTLDGVVSYGIPGKSGGGEISGFNAADRFIMGLLRASADAIVVGAGTLRDTAAGHLWLAEHVYPEARELYARYRLRSLKKPQPPLNVIVAGSGAVDLERAVFRTPGLKTLIITSPNGRERLASNGLESLPSVEARELDGPGGKISPVSILQLLRDEFAVNHLLHEGGPTLFGDFVTHGCVDELFLTVAPQFAGRDLKRAAPGSNLRNGIPSGDSAVVEDRQRKAERGSSLPAIQSSESRPLAIGASTVRTGAV